jgi:ketosteroid isomerase-like protein
MAVGGTAKQQAAVLTAYQFLDAFNEREADALATLVIDDAELRTSDERVWRGPAGARELLDEAGTMGLRLIPLHRGEHSEHRDGDVWVELRVRELVEDADVPRIADFVVRGGRILSFALRPAGYEPGLA